MAFAAFLAVAAPSTSFTPVPSLTVKLPSSKIFPRGNNVPPSCSSSSRNPLELREGKIDRTAGADDGGDGKAVENTKNPLELASWYAVEAFGKAFGSKKDSNGDASSDGGGGGAPAIDTTKPPSSLSETLERIRLDNDRSYFLSGEVDRLIYDEECTFADPFVSFDGRERFIDNLANLGSFITNYDARMIKYDVEKDGREIFTKVMVKLELNLPWKPVLAWPWGVLYEVDPETFLVTTHRESWDIEPLEGVLQIFRRPTVKVSKK